MVTIITVIIKKVVKESFFLNIFIELNYTKI